MSLFDLVTVSYPEPKIYCPSLFPPVREEEIYFSSVTSDPTFRMCESKSRGRTVLVVNHSSTSSLKKSRLLP